MPEGPAGSGLTRLGTLDLCPSRAGAGRLARLPGVAQARRARRVVIAWHDDADGSLRGKGVAARERGGVWQVEGVSPGVRDGSGKAWAPGAPPPVLVEAITAARLGVAADDLSPVARFTGRESFYTLGGSLPDGSLPDGVSAILMRGVVEAGETRDPVSRLRLSGPVQAVEAAYAGLVEALGLLVPRGGIPLGALGWPPALPSADLVAVDAAATVGAFVAAALPPLIWPVLTGMAALATDEAAVRVHETRVAVRRLRSVLGVVRRPAACAAADALRPMLHALAGRLGAVRDWDAFLEGSGARIAARLGDDPGAGRLLAAARRQRTAACGALRQALAGPEGRALERQLACVAALRPWEGVDGAQAALLAEGAAAFASGVLRKRLHRIRRAGRGFKHLAPEALHDLRKDGKRLRYAAEAFAPLFPSGPARRFLKRLRALQGALGEMQDAEVARDLLARLGSAGHGYAGGLAVGIAEGRSDHLRAKARAAWQSFGKAEAFWT